ncbi:MAG: hypothetical protein K2K04_02300, partial [Clostridia bacterium]|nr:hypothetical protein [Clostridia bacterium]
MLDNQDVEVETVESEVVANDETVTVETSEVVVGEQQSAPSENKIKAFGAKVKEWFRKRVVGLKRKPQNIALLFLLVTSLIYLFSLNTLSPGAYKDFKDTRWLGLCIFVNTLFSILVLVLFLNTFPKYPKANKKTGKKHYINYVMMALVFVFIAVMITFDVLYYVIFLKEIAGNEIIFFENMAQANKYKQFWSAKFAADPVLKPEAYKAYILQSFSVVITHIVFLAISAVLLATLPLYKKLI